MLMQSVEEATEAPAPRPVFVANKLAKVGDYAQAKALLDTVDLNTDETAAMIYIMVLDKMHAQAAKQDAVQSLIGALGAAPDCSNTYLTFLQRQAQRACLPAAPIETLLAAAAARDRQQGELEMVYEAIARRHKFALRKAPAALGLNFISLGTTCLPWTLLNRWGLRDRARFITDFNPFCLATHKIQGILAALESDFEDYTAPDRVTIGIGGRQPYAKHTDDTVEWNHNQGVYWTQDDCRMLRADMERKIGNFRASCKAEKPVFMLTGQLIHLNEPDYLPRLRTSLSKFTGRQDDYIVLTSQSAKSPRGRVREIDDRTFALYCPYPSRDYTWFDLNVADSPEGLAFERKYVRLLFNCLRRWGLLASA
jgi:hypothetical protein